MKKTIDTIKALVCLLCLGAISYSAIRVGSAVNEIRRDWLATSESGDPVVTDRTIEKSLALLAELRRAANSIAPRESTNHPMQVPTDPGPHRSRILYHHNLTTNIGRGIYLGTSTNLFAGDQEPNRIQAPGQMNVVRGQMNHSFASSTWSACTSVSIGDVTSYPPVWVLATNWSDHATDEWIAVAKRHGVVSLLELPNREYGLVASNLLSISEYKGRLFTNVIDSVAFNYTSRGYRFEIQRVPTKDFSWR